MRGCERNVKEIATTAWSLPLPSCGGLDVRMRSEFPQYHLSALCCGYVGPQNTGKVKMKYMPVGTTDLGSVLLHVGVGSTPTPPVDVFDPIGGVETNSLFSLNQLKGKVRGHMSFAILTL